MLLHPNSKSRLDTKIFGGNQIFLDRCFECWWKNLKGPNKLVFSCKELWQLCGCFVRLYVYMLFACFSIKIALVHAHIQQQTKRKIIAFSHSLHVMCPYCLPPTGMHDKDVIDTFSLLSDPNHVEVVIPYTYVHECVWCTYVHDCVGPGEAGG